MARVPPHTPLPDIPQLPPLQIGTEELSQATHVQDETKLGFEPNASTVSVASHDSFITAPSSTPPSNIDLDKPSPLRSPTLTPPGSSQGLRKSFSIDSFKYHQHTSPPPSAGGPRQHRVHTTAALFESQQYPTSDSNEHFVKQMGSQRDRELPPIPGHPTALSNEDHNTAPRAASITSELSQNVVASSPSTTPRPRHTNPIAEYDSTHPRNEHSVAASPPTSSRISMFGRGGAGRTLSVTSKASGSGSIRPPTLNTTSSMSSMSSSASTATTSSVTQDDITSHTNVVRRGTSASVGSYTQSRTSSTPLKASHSEGAVEVGSGVSIDTNIQAQRRDPLTIAVFGTVRCGKSTAIQKGLKAYGLSEPRLFVTQLSNEHSFRYYRRTGLVTDKEGREWPLHVLEVECPLPRWPGNATAPEGTWPDQAPKLDAVVLCYDASDSSSFSPVQEMLSAILTLSLPTIGLACKSDVQPRQVDPVSAMLIFQPYDVGLVEISIEDKEKIRKSFNWVLRAMLKSRDRVIGAQFNKGYRNLASPDILKAAAPWDSSSSVASHSNLAPHPASQSRTVTPTGKPVTVAEEAEQFTATHIPTRSMQESSIRTGLSSPTRVRSMGDLLSENERRRVDADWRPPERNGARSNAGASEEELRNTGAESSIDHDLAHGRNSEAIRSREAVRETKPSATQWVKLEDLLDKLLFLSISGDDPSFITHFLLTYRRFATPRSVLLAMQKRMRQLDEPTSDPMFACFAQMRICHLLEEWIQTYPHDFAVRNTPGALSALVKSIIAKTYLLHYGSEFLPFLEQLPELVDKDSAWAYKGEDEGDESSEDSYSMFDDDDSMDHHGNTGAGRVAVGEVSEDPASYTVEDPNSHSPSPVRDRRRATSGGTAVSMPITTTQSRVSRERKQSLPLNSKTLNPPSVPSQIASTTSSSSGTGPMSSNLNHSGQMDNMDMSPKQLLRELAKTAVEVNQIDSNEIAEEITRLEVKLFLDIEPRSWLQYTFVSGKKDPQSDLIARFNEVSNHLADWVVSLILCHDRPRMRAKQIEKFVEVAQKLRALNNYSALRAFVAGINNSTFDGDQTMEHFKARSPEQAKNLQSWDVLLQHIRSHRAYRMALKNTKGPCIPAQEVHMSDLIKAHEGNPDVKEDEPGKIHWGKFNLMGKFISTTIECQAQCRASNDYNFPARPHIHHLLLREYLMDDDMQKSRIAPPELDPIDDIYRPPNYGAHMSKMPTNNGKGEIALLKKLFFW